MWALSEAASQILIICDELVRQYGCIVSKQKSKRDYIMSEQEGSQELVQILDEDGVPLDDAEIPDLSDEKLLEIFRMMKLARRYDERAINLQRQGRMGTYSPIGGQEAGHAASAIALGENDWILPSHRADIASRIKGLGLEYHLMYCMGMERGNEIPEDATVFPICLPIASQIPHAVGMAWASEYLDEDRVFMPYFGDGGTSEGDFHEGLNFAGVFNTPTVFFINNNQWAISIGPDQQTKSQTLAEKANAYGFKGVRVDGMDPLAVYEVTKQAVEKARSPPEDELRPTLIEALTYRYGPHTTSDDPSVYRDEEELERWQERDPIDRMETFLRDTGRLDDDRLDSIETDLEAEIDKAIEIAESVEQPSPAEMFENTFEEPTPRQREQYEYLEMLREEYGDEAFSH
jgi:pyruvate dehydrogenase E1 component alpha subunit